MSVPIDRRHALRPHRCRPCGRYRSAVAVTGSRKTLGFCEILDSAEGVDEYLQRLMLSPQSLAQEYAEADISPQFRANGTTDPDDPAYADLAQAGFRDWRLDIGGLVDNPLQLSWPDDLRRLPSRTQITRHDCVEGWSCIGKWTGVPLALILQRAGLKPSAKYIVFYCADALEPTLDGSGKYYESIDLVDAFHPQTILAYAMNGAPLGIAYVVLRFVCGSNASSGTRWQNTSCGIEAVEGFGQLEGGRGGYWGRPRLRMVRRNL